MVQSLVACVRIPQFRLHAACQAQPVRAGPIAVVTHASDRAVLVDCCSRAAGAGIRPGMFMWDARQRCPTLTVVTVDPAALAWATDRVGQVLRDHADHSEAVGLGCWMVPLLALGAGLSHADAVAHQLQQDVVTRAALSCVVGVSARSGVAYIAAAAAQRTHVRVLVVRPGDECTFLAPLPVDYLPGVGARTREALRRLGIATAGQLADLSTAVLERAIGGRAWALQQQARGLDGGGTAASSQTISHAWQTRMAPCADARRLQAELAAVVETIGRDLRAQQTAAGTLTVLITWTDGTTTRRSVRLRPRCDLDHELRAAAWTAVHPLFRSRRLAVVQLAAAAAQLGPRERELFAADDGRVRRLQQAVDTIKQRWGSGAIQQGALLGYGALP